ncbi:MAG: hypothetical protein HZC38_12850 [Chloroflexi bacterium]|nr:hypothetical protein [Chloroflexota bacterium]
MSKKKQKQKNALAELIREMESNKLFKNQRIEIHKQGEKMSEVLGLFIAPYAQYAPNYEAYNRLVATAVVAWNAALLEGNHRRKFLNEIRKTLPNDKTTQQDFTDIVEGLIERKERFFADNHRNILNYKVVDIGRNYHLSVVSTPENLPPNGQPPQEKPKSSVGINVKNLLDAVFGTEK